MLRDAVSSVDRETFARSAECFTRKSPLTPELILALLLFQAADAGRHGYRDLIGAFWDDAGKRGVELPSEVSAAAYCQARHRLAAKGVRSVLHAVCDSFELVHGERFLWKGRRLLAVDGSSLQVERCPALDAHFRFFTGAHRPSAHLTTLYDVLAGLPLDVVVGAYDEQDRSGLWELLGRVRPGDVLILDRGFPSFDLLMWLASEGIDFVVRAQLSLAKSVRHFLASGDAEGVVELRPTQVSELQEGHLCLRAVRAGVPGGDPVILLTSLGPDVADCAEIAGVYRRRWAVEEHYKLTQSPHFGQGFLHARSVNGVEQEVYAQGLFLALTRHLAASAAEHRDVSYAELSTKGALLAVSGRLTRLALGGLAPAELVELLERIASSLEPKRPGRSFPRRSLTPQRKWGPYGKRRTAKSGAPLA